VGYNAGIAITTGANNTIIGSSADAVLVDGDNNTKVGHLCRSSATNVSNEVVLGSNGMIGKGASTAFISGGNGAVFAGNNATAFSQTSDRRIKKDIVPNTKGLAAIVQIEPKNFYYKSDEELQEELPGAAEGLPLDKLTTSAIAQELELIFPEAVEGRTKNNILSVNTDPIFWSMVNAIKELSAQNTALAARIETLEG
jgi:hypothetical protein